jgi:hypothetical protein
VFGAEGENDPTTLPSCWELIRRIDERIGMFVEAGVRVEIVETLVLVRNDNGLMQNCLLPCSHWRLMIG